MIQERKKDYLQRLIEEFFKKFGDVLNSGEKMNSTERKTLINNGFRFFFDNFGVANDSDVKTIGQKVGDNELLEQYARLLMLKHEMSDLHKKEELSLALSIVEYIQKVDSTYSWDRTILREDLLRLLEEKPLQNNI